MGPRIPIVSIRRIRLVLFQSASRAEQWLREFGEFRHRNSAEKGWIWISLEEGSAKGWSVYLSGCGVAAIHQPS